MIWVLRVVRACVVLGHCQEVVVQEAGFLLEKILVALLGSLGVEFQEVRI